ncbi:MAG: tetratricopeptide repeat protein, partial [Proteobacteria bacterium]|nr:tetratricopeptide repeat protein [Pseudomonadota bacterium]
RGLPEGEVVAGYKVGSRLGADGINSVHLCQPIDPAVEGKFTIWVVNGELAVDASAVQRYLMMMRILRTADSRAVQKVAAVGTLPDGRPYVVLHWVDGTILSAAAPVPVLKAISIAEGVLEALEALHARGIHHADLRVENVLLRDWDAAKEGPVEVVLLGLGTERLFPAIDSDGKTGVLAAYGVARGMAPELARGGAPDLSSDMYSLGCLMHEMVTGHPVFIGRAAADVMAAHMTKTPPAPSGAMEAPIPGAYDALVARLLAKEPSARPRAIDELRRLLADVKRAAEEMAARAAQTGTREDIATWADALLENPADAEVLEALTTDARRYNAWGAAIEVVEEAALLAEDPIVVRRLLMAAAAAATKHTKSYEKAGQIYEQLKVSTPDDPELDEATLDLLRAEGKFEQVVERLAARAEAFESETARMAVVQEIARTYYEDIKDFAKAFDYYAACLQATDDDREIAEILEKIAARVERWQDLATTCTSAAQAAEGAGNVDLAVFYYLKVGNIYLQRLDKANYALTCFQKVLEHKPAEGGALAALAELYRGAQQWTELADVLARLGDAEQVPSRGRDRLADAARIQYEKLSDSKAARALLERVLSEDPAHEAAGTLMLKLLEDAKDWSKLAALTATRVDAMPDGPEQVAARFRLGELCELRLNNLPTAQRHYERAIAADPKHLDSLKGLERIYARSADFPSLLANLEAQLEIAVTPRQRVQLLERIAEMYEEEFKNVDKAIECYVRLLEIDGDHVSALIALTRHYRKTSRHEDLIKVLERRAELVESAEDKRDLMTERAEIIRDDIKDAKRAAEAFQIVAALGGGGAYDALVRSQIEAGNFDEAIQTLDKMFAETADPAGKVEVLRRIAEVQHEKKGDLAEAAAALRRAKDLAPQSSAVIADLSKIYLKQGNYSSALDLLQAALDLAEGSLGRADVFARMGVICLENIGDAEKAISHFEHALALDESNFVAGDQVSTLYRKRGQWDKAIPIYERWAASSDALPPEKRLELFTQMGEAYVQLDRREDALKYFRRAAEVAAEPKLMMRLGEVALELGEFQIAKEQFQRYTEKVGDGLSLDEKVDLFVKHGRSLYGAGDVNEAAKLARQATVMAPENPEARLLLADVHEARGDFRSAVESRQRVLAGLGKEDKRWRELVRTTAGVQFEKLRDADGAATILKNALQVQPDDRDILGDLLKIYYATKRYADVIEIVLRIAGLVDDTQQMARYYLTVAKIYRRELRQFEDAIKYFEMAIEKDPTLDDAEKALVEVYTEKRDWDALERYYKRQIARLPKDSTAEEKLAAYVPLAELIIDKLERPKDGILLTEAISKLEPKNAAWIEKLAELYGWSPEYSKKAIATHTRLLEINPARVDSFRTLYRIHSGEENPDEAWCAVSILSLLNQASPEERKFYRDHQPADVPTPQSRVKEEHWKKLLMHNELDQNISAIFSVVGEAISHKKARDPKQFGLDPDTAVDVRKDGSSFAQFVNFAAGTLSIDPPKLYYHDGQGSGFQIVDTRPPVMVAGGTASSLKDRLGLAFALGQQLTLMSPGLYVKKLVSSGTELSAWLLASIKIFVQALPVPSELAGAVQERLQPLRDGLDASALERLQGYVQSFVSKAGDVNLKRWARSVDYTCDRAGLLLSGDVAVAVRILKEQISDKALLADRLRALTLFTISEEHHKLREQIGTALKVG